MNGKQLVVGGVVVLLLASLAMLPWLPSDATATTADSATIAMAQAADAPAAATPAATGAPGDATGLARVAVPLTPPLAQLTVQVGRIEDRHAVPDMPMLVRGPDETRRFGQTDAKGVARFTDLPPGDYSIMLVNWQSKTVTLLAGGDVTTGLFIPRGQTANGLVLAPDGQPVADAEILVSAPGIEPQWTFLAGRSDAQGRFQLANLRDGALIGARRAGLGTTPFQMLRDAESSSTVESLTLRLPGAGAHLRGRVVDVAGTPVANAWVRIGDYTGPEQDAAGNLMQAPPAALTSTDADGRFAVTELPVGEQGIAIYRRGLAPHHERIALVAGANADRSFVLRPGAALVGRVVLANGDAVPGAKIAAVGHSYPETSEAVSAADGSWVLRRGAAWVGRVVLANGDAVPGARVAASRDYPEPGSAVTAADGSFRIADFAPGPCDFEVTAPDLPRQRCTITFVADEVRQWDVTLRPGLAIHARLVDNRDQPLASWWLTLLGSNQGYSTDADGRCTLVEAKGADNTLLVQSTFGFAPVIRRFDHIAAGESELTFVIRAEDLPSAWLHGRALDTSGTPLPAVEIELEQDRRLVLMPTGNVRSAADGTFAIGPLPPGRYRALPSHRACVFAAASAELSARARIELGDLRGIAPARLVVRLTGSPIEVANAIVLLTGGDRQLAAQGSGSERTFVRVFPQRYRLVVRRNDRDEDCGEVDLQPGSDLVREIALR